MQAWQGSPAQAMLEAAADAPAMPSGEWVAVIEREYLDAFIPGGGASVKLAVPRDPASRQQVLELMPQAARRHGMVVARVDALDTRVHMVDEVFHRIAEQVPWQQLSRLMLSTLAEGGGYRAPALEDMGPSTSFLRAAAAGGEDAEMLRGDLRRALGQAVLRDPFMARDFRVAMNHLCRAELTGGEEGNRTREVITDWVTGRNRRIGPVKPYEIFTRIHRGNARHHLESLAHWVRRAGMPGTVVLIDIERLALARNPRDGSRYYTRPAVMDAYEVLRQLIDGTYRLQSLLVVVVAAPELLSAEPGTRGLADYQALRFRVYDEIRDRRLVNPMAALVRLAATAGAAGG